MKENNYAYSVARVRSKEVFLLKRTDLEQMLTADSYTVVLRTLRDKGYDNGDSSEKSGSLVQDATEELWKFLEEVADDTLLSFLQLPQDYHNIKVSVKATFIEQDPTLFLLPHGTIAGEKIANCIRQRDYSELPKSLAETAEESLRLLYRLQNRQVCEMHIDRAKLRALEDTAKQSDDTFLQDSAALTADLSNWKIALRCAMMHKSEEFLHYALYDGGTLYLDSLVKKAASGIEALVELLEQTGKSDGAEAMKQSAAAFETWCDNQYMDFLEQAKFESFTSAPILAYFNAKQTELRAVSLILSGKQNHIHDHLIRERVRRLYV